MSFVQKAEEFANKDRTKLRYSRASSIILASLLALALLYQTFLVNWTYCDGIGCFIGAVQVEKGEDLLREGVFQSVNMGPSPDIIKGHLPLLVVQVHAHSFGLGLEGEQRWG